MRLTRVLVSSMNLISQPDALETIGESISRPSSASRDDLDWNEYLRECKLFQPLAGVPPIATTPTAPQPRRASMAVLDAITEALAQRQQRESAIATGEFRMLAQHGRSGSHASSDDRPLSKLLGSPLTAFLIIQGCDDK